MKKFIIRSSNHEEIDDHITTVSKLY